MTSLSATTWKTARRALERAMALHLDDPNVSHIDLGFRTLTSESHRFVPELAVRVHVRQKLYDEKFEELASLQPQRVIDPQRIGFAVDVPQASFDLDWRPPIPELAPSTKAKNESESGLVQVANDEFLIRGGKVRDRSTGEEMILTTWHAMLGSFFIDSDAPIHRRRYGERNDAEGAPECARSGMDAYLDATAARVSGQRFFYPASSGLVKGPITPQLGMKVIKYGRGSKVTSGIITGILGCSRHRYAGAERPICHIIEIAPQNPEAEIRAPGDSGAWWIERSTRRAAGLHFAGSHIPSLAHALSMPEVLRALDIEIIPQHRRRSGSSTTIQKTIHTKEDPPLDKPNLPAHEGKINRFHFPFALSILIGLLGAATFGFTNYAVKVHQQQKKSIDGAKLTLQNLQTTAALDSARQKSVRKVVAITHQFNPAMSPRLRFTLANEIYEMTRKYPNLDVDLICATITHETGRTWNPRAVSWAGALGLMQIMPATGLELARKEGIDWKSAEEILFDPVKNIRLGCRYLSSLVEAYNVDGGLAAYNGGEKRAQRWVSKGRVDGILHKETANYVPAILKIYDQYRRMSI